VRDILQTLRLNSLFEIQAREDETLGGHHDHMCQ
jgi:hypothetical protein